MTESRPQISVVIPTRNRRASLHRVLAALEAQTFPLQRLEVIIVSDGCTDGTADMVRQYAGPCRIRLIEEAGVGAAAARNAGVRASSGWLLLFLDDDVEPTPPLVGAHVREHERGTGRVVLGPYPPALQGGTDFLHTLLRNWYDDQFSARAEPGHRFTYLDLWSGNFSLETDLFWHVGGFDPAIPGCGGEDWELGIRLLAAGASFRFVPEALAYHHEHQTTDLDRFLHRGWQEGRVDAYIGFRHPHVTPVLPLALPISRHMPLHKLLRTVAFRWPAMGQWIAHVTSAQLNLLERWRLRAQWRFICHRLRNYWYWRGVAIELARRGVSLKEFLSETNSFTPTIHANIDIDLDNGLEEAERRLNEVRPDGITIRLGSEPILQVPLHPSAEPLSSVHLKPLVSKHASARLHADRVRRDSSPSEHEVNCDTRITPLRPGLGIHRRHH